MRRRVHPGLPPRSLAARPTNAQLRQAHAATRAALAATAASEARYRLMAENAADVVTCVGPDLRRVFASPSCLEVFGYTPEEMLTLPTAALPHPDDEALVRETLMLLLSGGWRDRIRFRAIRRDGEVIWIEARARFDPTSRNVVVAMRDISLQKQTEDALNAANQTLQRLALQDSLTGLVNRRGFDQAIQHACATARRENSRIGLLLVDVDHFKSYNDRFGHQAGDTCLRHVAAAVQGRVRDGQLAARYGGDELAVLLPGAGAIGAVLVAARIRRAVRRLAIDHPASTGTVTLSVGAATIDPGGEGSAVALVARADRALYAAKAAGRDRVSLG